MIQKFSAYLYCKNLYTFDYMSISWGYHSIIKYPLSYSWNLMSVVRFR